MKFHLKENMEKGSKEVQQSNVLDSDLEFNKKNREDYERLMTESSTNTNDYWDKNNPFVKLLLLILGAFVILGFVYYLMTYLSHR